MHLVTPTAPAATIRTPRLEGATGPHSCGAWRVLACVRACDAEPGGSARCGWKGLLHSGQKTEQSQSVGSGAVHLLLLLGGGRRGGAGGRLTAAGRRPPPRRPRPSPPCPCPCPCPYRRRRPSHPTFAPCVSGKPARQTTIRGRAQRLVARIWVSGAHRSARSCLNIAICSSCSPPRPPAPSPLPAAISSPAAGGGGFLPPEYR